MQDIAPRKLKQHESEILDQLIPTIERLERIRQLGYSIAHSENQDCKNTYLTVTELAENCAEIFLQIATRFDESLILKELNDLTKRAGHEMQARLADEVLQLLPEVQRMEDLARAANDDRLTSAFFYRGKSFAAAIAGLMLAVSHHSDLCLEIAKSLKQFLVPNQPGKRITKTISRQR